MQRSRQNISPLGPLGILYKAVNIIRRSWCDLPVSKSHKRPLPAMLFLSKLRQPILCRSWVEQNIVLWYNYNSKLSAAFLTAPRIIGRSNDPARQILCIHTNNCRRVRFFRPILRLKIKKNAVMHLAMTPPPRKRCIL